MGRKRHNDESGIELARNNQYKYADFAIVELDTEEVHAIIEIDDYSHYGA